MASVASSYIGTNGANTLFKSYYGTSSTTTIRNVFNVSLPFLGFYTIGTPYANVNATECCERGVEQPDAELLRPVWRVHQRRDCLHAHRHYEHLVRPFPSASAKPDRC